MPALSPQSILDGRNPYRAPVALITALIVTGVCMLLAFAFYLTQNGAVSVVAGTFLALPTAVVCCGLLLLIDRLEPEPQLNLWLALGWGAGVAVLGALVINTMIGTLAGSIFGPENADVFSVTVVAPIVEESLKGSLLLYLLWVRRHEIDGATDGIVYAGMCGIGFALVENVLYYMRGMGEGGELLMTVFMRGVASPLGHPMYTSMIGLGVAYAATHRGPRGVLAVIGGWCGAVFLHALWNGTPAFLGNAGLGLAYLLLALVLIGLTVVVLLDRQRTIRLIGTHLPPYIPSGLVQSNDVHMLRSMGGRRSARRWARAQAGANGARAMADYQLAATELALLHEHASGGTVSAQAFYSRQGAILGLMRVARDAFFRRVPHAATPPWTPRQEQSGFFRLPQQLPQNQLPNYQRAPAPASPPVGQPAVRPARAGAPVAPNRAAPNQSGAAPPQSGPARTGIPRGPGGPGRGAAPQSPPSGNQPPRPTPGTARPGPPTESPWAGPAQQPPGPNQPGPEVGGQPPPQQSGPAHRGRQDGAWRAGPPPQR